MESLIVLINWGTPLGLGLFFLLSGAGCAFLFWGLVQMQKLKSGDDKGVKKAGTAM